MEENFWRSLNRSKKPSLTAKRLMAYCNEDSIASHQFSVFIRLYGKNQVMADTRTVTNRILEGASQNLVFFRFAQLRVEARIPNKSMQDDIRAVIVQIMVCRPFVMYQFIIA